VQPSQPQMRGGVEPGERLCEAVRTEGLTVLVRPLSVQPEAFTVDLLVMLGLSLLTLPFLFTGRRLGRREGAVLLGAYCAYVGFLYG
jgi:cation:H+ antiporter